MSLSQVPSWWLTLPGESWSACVMLALLDEVTSRGINKNDRAAVQVVWDKQDAIRTQRRGLKQEISQ